LTAENAMKCARIHPAEDRYAYGPADQLAEFARKHDMTMTGHALVWYRETPGWLVAGKKEEVLGKLKSDERHA
jgi:endo-1,4-beta-xylanase